jgi:hypothetical protein
LDTVTRASVPASHMRLYGTVTIMMVLCDSAGDVLVAVTVIV